MNKLLALALCLLVVVLGTGVLPARAAQAFNFVVTVSEQNLTAGSRNKIGFTLFNNSEKEVTGLDAKLALPATSSLVIMTDNWWRFSKVASESPVSFSTEIYAPASSIGSTYQATLTLTYNISDTHKLTEDHALGFVVYGRVEMTAYGVTVDPTPTAAGGNVTVSATLQNKGNAAATYVNVTLRGGSLSLRPESTTYIGTIDPNSPTPLSLTANILDGMSNGTYPVTIVVSYKDAQSRDLELLVPATVVVESSATGATVQTGQTIGLRAFLTQSWLITIGGVVVAAVVVAVLFYRRRRSTGRALRLGT